MLLVCERLNVCTKFQFYVKGIDLEFFVVVVKFSIELKNGIANYLVFITHMWSEINYQD